MNNALGFNSVALRHVLTAAHCVTTRDTKEQRLANHTFVWLGAHDRKKDHGGSTNARCC